uniref:Integrase core domain containing protein n=1 Tax=Solanum demissum TaxID=50514 RepID=Q6L3I6_SOLDE|nr:Integrase core domain containing protein [Solanum demissum]
MVSTSMVGQGTEVVALLAERDAGMTRNGSNDGIMQRAPQFNSGQYDQIVNMLDEEKSHVNIGGMIHSFMANIEQEKWIIDTGVSNHMTAHLDNLSDVRVINPEECENDLFNGKVKGIGREKGDLYLLNSKNSTKRVIAEIGTCFQHNYEGATWLQIRSFFKMLQTQFKAEIQTVRSDNGGDFVNSNLAKWCKDLGIVHQKTCAYTPQQNGVAERKHRHLLELARALKFQGHIPITFWGHCVLTSAYIINRLPSIVLQGKSPYEMLFNKKPRLDHLRTLGCLCYASVLPKVDKFASRVVQVIFMGHSSVTKGYIIFDIAKQKFFVNRGVVFREFTFPFQNSSTSDGACSSDTGFEPSYNPSTFDTHPDILTCPDLTHHVPNSPLDASHVPAPVAIPVYKVKLQANGDIERFKARLVAKGYNQKEGLDYNETFPLVVKIATGDLYDKVYMQLPQGFPSQRESGIVCRLVKSLYGLKQATAKEITLGCSNKDNQICQETIRAWNSDGQQKIQCYGSILLFRLCLMPKYQKSKKQTTMSRSSAEAEYRSMGNAVAEQSTAANPVFHERTKHIKIDCHFIRQKIQERWVKTEHVGTKDQIADILRKELPRAQHEYLVGKLGMLNIFAPASLRGSEEMGIG